MEASSSTTDPTWATYEQHSHYDRYSQSLRPLGEHGSPSCAGSKEQSSATTDTRPPQKPTLRVGTKTSNLRSGFLMCQEGSSDICIICICSNAAAAAQGLSLSVSWRLLLIAIPTC